MELLFSAMLSLSLLLSPIRGQDDNFLDLVKAREEERKKEKRADQIISSSKEFTTSKIKVPIFAPGVSHAPPPKPSPLKITLFNLDKTVYTVGDDVIFDILVENISQESVVIPWSSDIDKVIPADNSAPPGYRAAILKLIVADDGSRKYQFNGAIIYGSQLLAGSLKTLEPGYQVRIKVPGYFRFPMSDEKMIKELRAEFCFISGNYLSSISENGIPIELRKRLDR
jgi:hypothetical protein